jgi:alpha-tubulin suppressor-like RCC1 family protein
MYTEEISGKITIVHAASNHTMIITDKGVLASGRNNHGQLGQADKKDRDTFNVVTNLPKGGMTKKRLVEFFI